MSIMLVSLNDNSINQTISVWRLNQTFVSSHFCIGLCIAKKYSIMFVTINRKIYPIFV